MQHLRYGINFPILFMLHMFYTALPIVLMLCRHALLSTCRMEFSILDLKLAIFPRLYCLSLSLFWTDLMAYSLLGVLKSLATISRSNCGRLLGAL